ncbi:beta-lactamase, putative [Babesia ovata]|uniref:Beta-lactamase, putative n=1 Tax=Babesia ovata TaxID=189622 RepID=A0A2H6K6L0_9APIC|nr:beta-lactamase, putative [Babesia ovata]GBE58621.1 beta-lactamase, putative [Babesia ovata]
MAFCGLLVMVPSTLGCRGLIPGMLNGSIGDTGNPCGVAELPNAFTAPAATNECMAASRAFSMSQEEPLGGRAPPGAAERPSAMYEATAPPSAAFRSTLWDLAWTPRFPLALCVGGMYGVGSSSLKIRGASFEIQAS